MLQTPRLQRVSFSVLVALTCAWPTVPTVAAPAALDGVPSADACQKLGFAPGYDRARDGRTVASVASPAMAYAVPPPPPSPYPQAKGSPSTEARRVAPPGRQPQAGDIETEKYPHAAMNPVKRTAEEPVSTFSIDVDTAAYANVRRFLNDETKPPRDAVRVEELVNYFDYGYARPATSEQPFASYVAVVPSPWSKDRQILQIGLQGYEQPRTSQAPLNLVFLIDTSGSMESEDKLPLARKAMNILIDQLGAQDRVSIVAYAGSAGAVLAPTSGREKLKMRCALGALSAGGSTAGGEGLALAYGLAKQNFDPKAITA